MTELIEEALYRRVGARIDRRLCFPLSACVSADPGGDRHAETRHPVEHVAPDFRLGPSWVRGVEAHEANRIGLNRLTVVDTGAVKSTCA